MTSAHQHHSRYSLPPPPQNSQSDFRLPSLKDLNFQYRSPNGTAPAPQSTPSELAAAQQEHPSNSRHVSTWSRPNPPPNPTPTSSQSHPHQQLTPPLSAGHETTLKVDYPSKHENGGYVHPGMPLSAQVTPVPGSVNIGNQPRTEEPPHSPNQAKRPRNTSANVGQSREARTSHVIFDFTFFYFRVFSLTTAPFSFLFSLLMHIRNTLLTRRWLHRSIALTTKSLQACQVLRITLFNLHLHLHLQHPMNRSTITLCP